MARHRDRAEPSQCRHPRRVGPVVAGPRCSRIHCRPCSWRTRRRGKDGSEALIGPHARQPAPDRDGRNRDVAERAARFRSDVAEGFPSATTCRAAPSLSRTFGRDRRQIWRSVARQLDARGAATRSRRTRTSTGPSAAIPSEETRAWPQHSDHTRLQTFAVPPSPRCARGGHRPDCSTREAMKLYNVPNTAAITIRRRSPRSAISADRLQSSGLHGTNKPRKMVDDWHIRKQRQDARQQIC